MTQQEYKTCFTRWAALTEQRLEALCDAYLPATSQIGQAARYSLLGGGKRVRAVLTLAACARAGAPAEQALDYACALEMLHCYSLIHDDLPAVAVPAATNSLAMPPHCWPPTLWSPLPLR